MIRITARANPSLAVCFCSKLLEFVKEFDEDFLKSLI